MALAAEQEEVAARAYDAAARQLRGPEAHGSKFQLNFPTAEEQKNLMSLKPFAESFATEDEVQAVLFAASSADSNVPEIIHDELAEIDALRNEEAQVDRQLVKLEQTMS
eukprot:COSAG06_NODE_14257_length_1174_cov_0.773023_1_plen_108_part_10